MSAEDIPEFQTQHSSRPGHPTLNSTNLRPVESNRQRRQQPPKQQQLPTQRPQFSLAGSYAPAAPAPSYVDPAYYQLNPDYNKPKNKPVWGLAKPLPRVVRPGMRPATESSQDKKNEATATETRDYVQGAEPAPEVGQIPAQRQDERQPPLRQPSNILAPVETSQTVLSNTASAFDKYGSPRSERENPMEQWTAGADPQAVNEPSNPDLEPDIEAGDKLDMAYVDEDTAIDPFEDSGVDHVFNRWSSIRAQFREPLAECLATMIAVTIGLCVNLAVLTSNDSKGDYQSSNWSWGLGVMLGIYIAGGISGAHLNPAISITLCIYRGFPAKKTFMYVCAQVVGAFLAGLIAYGVYQDAILNFDNGHRIPDNTGIAFYTQPSDFVTPLTAFFSEFVATGILACAILALGDDSNAPPGAGMHALIVGLVVTVLTMAFGYNTGACMNPARDFGPRLATLIVGYGGEVFRSNSGWFVYGAWAATISGALVGGFLYDVAIFVGGESPVNYTRRRRRRATMKMKKRWWKRIRKNEEKVKELEGEIKKDLNMGR